MNIRESNYGQVLAWVERASSDQVTLKLFQLDAKLREAQEDLRMTENLIDRIAEDLVLISAEIEDCKPDPQAE